MKSEKEFLPAEGLGEKSNIFCTKSLVWRFQRSLSTLAWMDGKTS